MTIDDIDVMELNEAFAAQVIPVCREVGIDPFGEKLNPHGGAIALGHPYGMTGARIMCTLLNDLDTLDGTIGLETMCVGGGQGMAMIVERLELDARAARSALADRARGRGRVGSRARRAVRARALLVCRARRATSAQVLKVTPPEDDESTRRRTRSSSGPATARCGCSGDDRARRALLLERARPGTDIADAARRRGDRDRRRRRAAAVAAGRRRRSAGSATRAALARRGERASCSRARAGALALASKLRHDVLVHGDFHHHNILASARG